MLAPVGRGLGWAIVGYLVGAVMTYGLIMWLSSNVHDRQMEAGMTGAFVVGPLCALVGLIAGVARRPNSDA